ncbi:putative calcium-binding protein CML41 [Drosera capensis]
MATECLPNPSKWFCAKVPQLKNLSKPKSPKSPLTSTASSSPSPRSNSSSFKSLSRSREDELKDVFDHFDMNKDGKISAYELRAFFGSIGEHMSHEDAQGVIDDVDSNGDGMLGFRDFSRLMGGKIGVGIENVPRDDGDDDLKKVFEMFEEEKGSGRITPKGLQRMLDRLGDSKSYYECVAMIQNYDTDGNGELDFHEFHQMIKEYPHISKSEDKAQQAHHSGINQSSAEMVRFLEQILLHHHIFYLIVAAGATMHSNGVLPSPPCDLEHGTIVEAVNLPVIVLTIGFDVSLFLDILYRRLHVGKSRAYPGLAWFIIAQGHLIHGYTCKSTTTYLQEIPASA